MTLRLRLTLLYGGCFLVAGAALLGITYALVSGDSLTRPQMVHVRSVQIRLPAFGGQFTVVRQPFGGGRPVIAAGAATNPGLVLSRLRNDSQKQIQSVVRRANAALTLQRRRSLNSLLTESGIALAIMALLSIGLGWLVAGRALNPLRTMNARARRITEDSLHERLGLGDRRDELGQLAASFDAVLARLERAFESQQRFVANASHELRTPLTLERALVEVALADPDSDVESLRHTCRRVLAAAEQQEQVIDALLALARGQAGVRSPQQVDLASLVDALLSERRLDTASLTLSADLAPAAVPGDPALLERLVANLLDNAIRHNLRDGGWIRLSTRTTDGRAELTVANSGPVIPVAALDDLFEPFRRLEGERTGHGQGLGLGLSIVRAIAGAHRAEIASAALPAGGLELSLRFPAVSAAVPLNDVELVS